MEVAREAAGRRHRVAGEGQSGPSWNHGRRRRRLRDVPRFLDGKDRHDVPDHDRSPADHGPHPPEVAQVRGGGCRPGHRRGTGRPPHRAGGGGRLGRDPGRAERGDRRGDRGGELIRRLRLRNALRRHCHLQCLDLRLVRRPGNGAPGRGRGPGGGPHGYQPGVGDRDPVGIVCSRR